MLTDKEIAHYEALLLARRDEVELQFSQTEEMAAPVSPDPAIGRLSRQDAMQDQQMTLETRRRLELDRTRIATALERLKHGNFGVCVLCKQPIPPQRLEIVPESPLCVPCQEKRSKS